MTTNFKVVYSSGNKDIEVVEQTSGRVAATLRRPGDQFDNYLTDSQSFVLREAGEFRTLDAEEAAQLDADADQADPPTGEQPKANEPDTAGPPRV